MEYADPHTGCPRKYGHLSLNAYKALLEAPIGKSILRISAFSRVQKVQDSVHVSMRKSHLKTGTLTQSLFFLGHPVHLQLPASNVSLFSVLNLYKNGKVHTEEHFILLF